MKKNLLTKKEIPLFILMFITYCITIYCIINKHLLFMLIFFIINNCLTIYSFICLLRNHKAIVSEQSSINSAVSITDKSAFIMQASQTIAHLQQINNNLTEENKRLERLVYEK